MVIGRGNAASYGLAVGAVPAKVVPEVLDEIVARYAGERRPGESFQDWTNRLGKKVRAILEPFMVAPYEEKPSLYSDWGDPAIYHSAIWAWEMRRGDSLPVFQWKHPGRAEAFRSVGPG